MDKFDKMREQLRESREKLYAASEKRRQDLFDAVANDRNKLLEGLRKWRPGSERESAAQKPKLPEGADRAKPQEPPPPPPRKEEPPPAQVTNIADVIKNAFVAMLGPLTDIFATKSYAQVVAKHAQTAAVSEAVDTAGGMMRSPFTSSPRCSNAGQTLYVLGSYSTETDFIYRSGDYLYGNFVVMQWNDDGCPDYPLNEEGLSSGSWAEVSLPLIGVTSCDDESESEE